MTSNQGKVVNRFCFSELFAEAWMKSMTLTNITAGFRVTGVYPVNRNAFVLPEEECHNHIDSSLAASNGLKYIPLYSPACQHTQSCTTPIVEADRDSEMFSRESSPEVDQSQDPELTQFTVEEMKKFEKRYENGYDIRSDSRYNLWLNVFHSSERCLRSSSLSNLNDNSVYQSPDTTINRSFSNSELGICSPIKEKAKLLPGKTVMSKFLEYPIPTSKLPHIKPKGSARVLTSSENIKKLLKEQKKCLKHQQRRVPKGKYIIERGYS